ncbi:MAG: prenyltransferase/squalene oxidase repeat-containing protein [Planctomycetota bacterium]|jgi:squalene-hopene/tetraprenyl-beta-curcumene cyclase
MKLRAPCLAVLLCAFLSGCAGKVTTSDPSAAWLVARQSPDGAWRSDVYDNIFEDGATLTAFVLHALSFVPDVDRSVADRGLRFLRKRNCERAGYPTYAAALTILVLEHYRPDEWEADVARLVRFLRARQLVESNLWMPEDPEYGSWDHGAVVPRKPDSQKPEISVTAFAVEALRAGGVAPDDPAIRAALVFLSRCRNEDGGFFFTPQKRIDYQNKAGRTEKGYRSYGTATCDAVRILRAAGVPDDEPRAWLEKNSPVEFPGGFPGGQNHEWAGGLRFYYYYVRSSVLPSAELRRHVLSLRGEDGSWVNTLGLMKEDDPVITTGLALIAARRPPQAP